MRRTGARLQVGQSTRFFEPFRRQRRALERGELVGLAGIETFCVIEAVERSAALGRPVRIAPILEEVGW